MNSNHILYGNGNGNGNETNQSEANSRKELTNSTKAWLRLAPTLHLVLTILPKGLQSSMSSSSVHSHGRLRRWRTFDGVWVYRNWGCPEVDIQGFLRCLAVEKVQGFYRERFESSRGRCERGVNLKVFIWDRESGVCWLFVNLPFSPWRQHA